MNTHTSDSEISERIREIQDALPILREAHFITTKGRTCGAPGWLADLIRCAVRWEIGESFRVLRTENDRELITSLARLSLGLPHN